MRALNRLRSYLWKPGHTDGDEPQYKCRKCEASFEDQPQVCPECGCYDIQRTAWTGSTWPQSMRR
jgi:rubrerythrin